MRPSSVFVKAAAGIVGAIQVSRWNLTFVRCKVEAVH